MTGGYSPSMLRAIQTTVLTSKALLISKEQTAMVDLKDAFRLATMGRAYALGSETVIGAFAVEKSSDAIVVDTLAFQNLDFTDHEPALDTIQKLLYNGDARNFQRAFVSGKLVHVRHQPGE